MSDPSRSPPAHLGIRPPRKGKRPSGAAQGAARALDAVSRARDVRSEPRPDCSHAVPEGDAVYCTERTLLERAGAPGALRCRGERCGRADLPPDPPKDSARGR
jgi:hypothetical protein